MVHGETRIVLRNPISGNILKDVTSENTFQGSVIANGFRNLGAANSSFYNNADVRNNQLWQELVGGILLFKDSITAGKHYMPAGNKMVGNGSYGVVNSSNPTELGSYNSNESSASAAAITQVYDFTTAQANGVISSVCLTSRLGGYMGYGNPSGGISRIQTPQFTARQDLQALYNLEGTGDLNRATVGQHVYTFTWDNENKTLTVRKWRVPITSGSVFDWMIVSTNVIDCSSLDHEYVAYGGGITTCGVWDGKIYLGSNWGHTVTPNSTWKFWVYDTSTGTLSQTSFINTASSNILERYYSVSQGILFARKEQSLEMSLFNLSTNVHIGDKTITNNEHWFSHDIKCGDLPEGLTCMPMSIDDGVRIGVYDPINDTLYPTNGFANTDYKFMPYVYDATTDTIQYSARYNWYAFNNPLYLATINNLDSPVTKTSAQTMKITYSLTEA